MNTTHGPCHEFARANRWGGPMYWPSAELTNIGPIVRARPIHDDGTRGRWETMALALDPVRYMRATAIGDADVVIRGRR